MDLGALDQQSQSTGGPTKQPPSNNGSSSYAGSTGHHDKLDESLNGGASVASSTHSGLSGVSSHHHHHQHLHSAPPAAAGSPTPSMDLDLMPDFALAELTPHMMAPGDDPMGSTLVLASPQPLRFGAIIRLWIAEEDVNSKMAGHGGGGFLGFAARDLRRINGELPQAGRFNVGMNDTFFVLPPYRPGLGWHFKETYFKVEDPKEGGAKREGEVVRYGEELLLVDEEDHVMCHFRGRKYIRRKPKGTKGEMSVSFLPPQDLRMGAEIYYGDTDIRINLTTRKGLRTEATTLSALRRDSIDAVGGFLNCRGRGKELTFDIEHAPPRINEISLTSTLLHSRQVYVSRSLHHRVHWGQQVGFATPSCQAHGPEEHEGCTIRITLSNGSRLKMQQGHLEWTGLGAGGSDMKRREMWMPTKGIPGENVDVLIRLVHVDTLPMDPLRHFGGSAPGGASARAMGDAVAAGAPAYSSHPPSSVAALVSAVSTTVQELLAKLPPVGALALFVLIELWWTADPALPLRARVGELGRVVVAFVLACLNYEGLRQLVALVAGGGSEQLQQQQQQQQQQQDTIGIPLSAPSQASLALLPASMLFDRWELVVLDWRVAGEEAAQQAPVPPPVPPTFVDAEKGDLEKAKERWNKTLAWRKLHDVDHVLEHAHPKFALIKALYPQHFHYRDKDGHVCFYEILGKLQVGELLRQGVGLADLTKHVILQQEFLWSVLQPSQEERVTLVLDLKGVSFADVTGEVINFAKTAVGLTSTHYPARSFRMLILFVPGWFNLIFRFIKPMLNEDTKRKIIFLEEAAIRDGAMLQYIDADSLPREYGGSCPVPLGESPFEQQLREIVAKGMAAAAEEGSGSGEED